MKWVLPKVADRVIFMDEGQIIEQNEPEAFSASRIRANTAIPFTGSEPLIAGAMSVDGFPALQDL